jgi:tRNA threonylcarbamoyladenosine modification (KEOPS) complex Cgi121 subunit
MKSLRNAVTGINGEIGFMMGFRLNEAIDLQSVATRFPEGIVLCNPDLVAGTDHIMGVLNQAKEYWQRDESLARNRSIDLLMRITCKKQIAEAVASSRISKTNFVAIFGFAKTRTQIEKSEEIIRSIAKSSERDDEILSMNKKKLEYLKEFHKLPKWFDEAQLLIALNEKSVLLAFAK